jgi:two-component system chemotaxis sensor kinase CheA
LRRAIDRGLVPKNSTPSDQQILDLVFLPGFSTKEKIDEVSGRGVGMDVVKRNIQALGGSVEIQSQLNMGTTMSIRVPLTLAILDGMSIAVDGETFIVPLTAIVESLRPRRGDIETVQGMGEVVRVRGEFLPIVRLHEVFGIRSRIKDVEQGLFMILEAEGGKKAILVDELLGQHQVVIKSLETNYRKTPGISGATIMGDGRVALILDVASIIRMPVRALRAAA